MSYGPPPGSPAPAKPGQVTAIQVILWIELALTVCVGLLAFTGGAVMGAAGADSGATGLVLISGILSIVVGIAAGVMAFNVPKRKAWVRTGVLVLSGVGILFAILNIVGGGGGAGFGGVLVPVVLIILALSQPAKDWFTEQ